MGVGLGVVVGIIGIAILLIPFIIQIYIGTKQVSTNYKRSLEAASAIIVLAVIFYVGGIILAGYYSGKEIAAAQGTLYGKGGKFIEEHPQLALLAA